MSSESTSNSSAVQNDIEAVRLSGGRIAALTLTPGALTVGLSLPKTSHLQGAGVPPLLATLNSPDLARA
jgi:hypothetical protein